MNEADAYAIVGALTVIDHRTWAEDTIVAWAKMIQTHGNPHAGMRASQALIESKHPRDWSIAAWREAYRQAVASEGPIALPRGDVPGCTLDEHIAALEADGSPQALNEIRLWTETRMGREMRDLTVDLDVRGNRRRDPHNYHATMKPIVDRLVQAGLWPDDTPE